MDSEEFKKELRKTGVKVINILTSSKFWVCTAAGLAAVATCIEGLNTDNPALAGFCVFCTVASAGLYGYFRMKTDTAAINADTTTTTKTVSASSSDKATVSAALTSGSDTKAA